MFKYVSYLVFTLVAVLFSNNVNSQILTVLTSNGNLTSLLKNNTNYFLNLTGSNQSSILGGVDGIYSHDSSLPKAKTHAEILKIVQQDEDYGLFKIKMLPDWKFDQNATDKNTLTFKHYINGEINYNVRIIQNPTICNSSKDFNTQVRNFFDAQYKKGEYVDKFKPNSEYNFLGHSNCHLMTYINSETNRRAFVLNAHVNDKRYSVYIFDYKSKKKELRKEIIDFIEGISLNIDYEPLIVEKNIEILNKEKNEVAENNKSLPSNNKIDKTIAKINNAITKINNIFNNTDKPNSNPVTNTKSEPNNPITSVPQNTTPKFNLDKQSDIPPSKPLPFLDITTISKTEWDGAVSAAMEGMRMVYGPMTDEDDKNFVKSWAPLRQTPFKEAVDYLNKFNPLLGEFLTYRTSISQTGILLEESVKNAGIAAEYDDPQLSLGYLDLASKYRNLLISRQKRLQQITNDLIALGNPPDGAQMMADQQRRYKQEKDYLKGLVNNFDPEGCWAGYMNTFWDKYLGKGDIHEPKFQYFYKIDVDGIETYYSIEICQNCNLGLTNTKVNCSSSAGDDTWIRNQYKSANYVGIGEGGANDGKVFRVLNKFEYPNIPEFHETSENRYNELIAAEKAKYKDNPVHQDISLFMNYLGIKRIADVFFKTALRWTDENKWEQFEHPKDGRRAPEALLLAFSNEMTAGAGNELVQNNVKTNISTKVSQKDEVSDNSNENKLHIIDDKNAEDRKKIDTEAIEFHKNNLAIIQKNMVRDQEDMAKEKDPIRLKDFQMRILGAQANIQAENDRIATIQTGIIVHNRSPWDDYAKSNFIQNIAENQQRMENISKGIRQAYEMADRLPDEEARAMRAIIGEKYNGNIMANLDEKAAQNIIDEAYTIGKKYYQGKMDVAMATNKEAVAEAEWANSCLQTAEIVKKTADNSMMVLSLFGGKYVNNTYQGITGYIEGGPKEAFLRVAGSYNTVTGVAVDGFRGFENAVNQGGDFIDGALGAGWEVTKGLITDKALSYGVGKFSASFNRPNGDLPNIDGPTKTGKGIEANNTTVFKKNNTRSVEPDFNRPLNTQEIEIHRQQVADGRNKVNSYKKTYEKLETARKAGAPPSEIKQILVELDDRSAKIHSSPQAKIMMKTLQKHPKNLDMIKRYSNSMDRVHQKVEKRFQVEMEKNGWSPEELEPIRNRPDPADLQRARDAQARGEKVQPEDLLGSKTVNMDYDAGRKTKLGANGKPIPPNKNGKNVPIEAWHAEAQAAWEKSYQAETGQSPTHSWENITHGKLGDAYADLNVLQKNGILHANKEWAGQTADVSYYKAAHLRGSQEFQRAEKYVEIARGTSKDCRTKMMPLFEQKKPKAGTPSYDAWLKHKNYWEKTNGVLENMGNGKIDPLTADREIREITGGKSVLEVTFDMRNFMESLLKLGNN